MDKENDDKKGGLSPDDANLWQKMTRDVKKMPGKRYVKGVFPEKAVKKPDSGIVSSESAPVLPSQSVKGTRGREIDKRTEQKLRRGQMAVEARIDLHGMTQPEAQAALERFIAHSYVCGKRTVLVITGKGERNQGVLRLGVPVWLDAMAVVLKAVTAQPQDGGSGALYVYLRKNRDL